MKHINNRVEIVDKYGSAVAATVNCKEKQNEVRGTIVKWGDGDYNGNLFRVTVRTTDVETIPNEVLLLKLATIMPPKSFKQWIKRHTEKGRKTTVKCTAKVQDK